MRWSVAEKARIVMETNELDGEHLSVYLEKEGATLGELEQWRLALEEEGRASSVTNRHIRNLERELARKEKALAEAAALLVLKKKVHVLLGDEADDTEGKSEK